MDAIILQILNGLDKGSAYALIALGLTLIFGTLGVVNFAHGALFMIGAFCAVTLSRILNISFTTIDETQTDFLGNPLKVQNTYIEAWLGPELGGTILDWSVPLAILFAIPIMILVGVIMERGLIKHFYKRPHADQILVTFGLAIVLQEIIKFYYGANPIPTPAPDAFTGSFDFGTLIGFEANQIIYPYWRLVYFAFAAIIIGAWAACPARSSPSCSSPPSAWWCAPAWPTARRCSFWASTSTSGSPSCSASPPQSRGSRA